MGKGTKIKVSEDLPPATCTALHGHTINVGNKTVCVFVQDEDGRPIDASVEHVGGGRIQVHIDRKE